MKHRFLVISFLTFFFFLTTPSLALGVCDVAGEPCCSEERIEGGYRGFCNNDLQCDILDIPRFTAGENGPGISECVDVPCGHAGEPCCSGTCLESNLECHLSGYGDYENICNVPQKFNKTSVTCATPDGEEGVITALGCVDVSSGTGLVSSILKLATGIGGGLALALILFGVFIVTTSAGSPDKLNKGKEIITSAIIGLVFILLSVFLMNLIGINILGIPGLS